MKALKCHWLTQYFLVPSWVAISPHLQNSNGKKMYISEIFANLTATLFFPFKIKKTGCIYKYGHKQDRLYEFHCPVNVMLYPKTTSFGRNLSVRTKIHCLVGMCLSPLNTGACDWPMSFCSWKREIMQECVYLWNPLTVCVRKEGRESEPKNEGTGWNAEETGVPGSLLSSVAKHLSSAREYPGWHKHVFARAHKHSTAQRLPSDAMEFPKLLSSFAAHKRNGTTESRKPSSPYTHTHTSSHLPASIRGKATSLEPLYPTRGGHPRVAVVVVVVLVVAKSVCCLSKSTSLVFLSVLENVLLPLRAC